MPEFLHCPAVLALELPPDAAPARRHLERVEAERCAALLAEDLHRLLPDSHTAHLGVIGALYDAAQLLRPGFPVLATLADLSARGVGNSTQAQVIAFGSHEGAMPAPALEPRVELGTGPMLLLPFTLFADAEQADALGGRMESEFLARGEAGAALGDFLMRTLGVRLEHARYLTRHDLCALTCVQLEHAGLSSAWEMLETALLSPQAAHESFSARGRTWRYADGAVHTPSPAYSTWLAAQGAHIDPAERTHSWAGAQFELRQFLALFKAHDLPVVFEGVEQFGSGAIETVAPVDPALPTPRLIAHEARGLGVVALSVVQDAPVPRVLANAFPLTAGDMAALLAVLVQRYDCGEGIDRLGRIELEEEGTALTAPVHRLH
jgi:hypothetical protein